MKKAISLILVFMLLDVPESLLPALALFSPAQAEAANWACGQDLNGNGYAGDPGETAKCISTQQGQLCPIGVAGCSTTQICPLGNFACSEGACTQTGTCSPVQIQVTQYKCPATGQIYSDQTTCNNNCIQKANCTTGQVRVNRDYTFIGGWDADGGSKQCFYSTGWLTNCLELVYSVSSWNTCWNSYLNNPTRIASYINSVFLHNNPNEYVVSVNSVRASGMSNLSGCFGSDNDDTDVYMYVNVDVLKTDAPVCPLAGGSACSGNPYSCTAKQACTDINSTVTKYPCSLNGVQYDTLSQCASVCTKTASCSTSYICPFGSQYACMNNSGAMQCSSNQCVDLDTIPEEITNVDDTMLQNDGARDASGNCLGTIYIFTGRGMRCRKPGVSNGFHNCCDNDRGNMLTDSTGSLAELQTAVSAIQTIYQMAQVAYYVNAILTTGTAPAGLASASSAVQSAVYSGVMGQSVEAGLQAYAGAFLNPTTIAITAAIYLITQFLMSSCDKQDMETAILNDSGYCHFVGEYCEKKWPVVGCVQKAKGYCCFNSKMGRIIHEQGRPQLLAFQPGGAWGSGKSPNCRGFTPEEFQMLDFGKMDLSEYFGDIQKDMAEKLQNMGTDATQKIQQFHQDIR